MKSSSGALLSPPKAGRSPPKSRRSPPKARRSPPKAGRSPPKAGRSPHKAGKNEWAPRTVSRSKDSDWYAAKQRHDHYSRLLALVQERMLRDDSRLARVSRVTCLRAQGIHLPRSTETFVQIVTDPNNFSPQQLTGSEFEDRVSASKLKTLVQAYEQVWNSSAQPTFLDDGTTYNLDDRLLSSVVHVVAQHAHTFLPMIRAMFAAKYVRPNHRIFQLKYRFQSVRHAHASAWHMDNGDFQTYADDGNMAARWTETLSRALVTSACVNMNPSSADSSLWHNCGTNVAIGTPVLRPEALTQIMESVHREVEEQDASGACLLKKALLHRRVTSGLQDATESGIQDFALEGGRLSRAGVKTLTLENGVISDYNDFMFHQANTDVPDGYQRVFFVLSGLPQDKTGKPQPYSVHAKVTDDRNGHVYDLTIDSI